MSDSPFEIRSSPIAGEGAFAVRPIRKGTRIIEYLGERVSQAEADRRYDDTLVEHPLVLLFTVDDRTVIDAGVGGNEARFINHSCEPNCKSVTRRRRVHIWAIRNISPGEELTYDYNLTRDGITDEEAYTRYACRCGASACRGTLLALK
jgi:SET domain-containing protein